MTVDFTSNAAEWRARMLEIVANVKPLMALELKAFAEEVMKDSRDNYCPIQEPPENDIRLEETGTVDEPIITPEDVSVRLSYGGEAHEYAIAIHEHVSEHTPPSWRGKAVSFRVGGPKYLERPVMEHSKDMPIIADKTIKILFGGIRVSAS